MLSCFSQKRCMLYDVFSMVRYSHDEETRSGNFLIPAPFYDRTFYYPSSLIKTDSYIPTLYSKLHKLPASIYGNCLFAR